MAVASKTCTHFTCSFSLFTVPVITLILLLSPSLSWYWGDVPRPEAEKWLLNNDSKSGTFLVRMSSSQKDSLSLSVRDGESVKHYRIRRFDDGGYYVASRATFISLQVCNSHMHYDSVEVYSASIAVQPHMTIPRCNHVTEEKQCN